MAVNTPEPPRPNAAALAKGAPSRDPFIRALREAPQIEAPAIPTPLGVLQGRFDIVDYLLRKELDDLNACRRAERRHLDRLQELGQERDALKRAAAALSDETDINSDERTAA